MGCRVVTISASYGAGGSVVGPAVADRLGIPFVDRAIPASVAEQLEVPLEAALFHDERAESGFWRSLALMGSGTMLPHASGAVIDATNATADRFRSQTEEVIRCVAEGTGGVILGRAAQIVLADRDDTLRVRLDGPVDRRIAQAAELGDTDPVANQRNFDRAWDAYVKRFYRADPRDPKHYHLLLDSTCLSLDACTDVIAAAARGQYR